MTLGDGGGGKRGGMEDFGIQVQTRDVLLYLENGLLASPQPSRI